jgi:spermidine synthase
MAISYQHPKVKVHVGDGFKFLDDYKNEFDVIITDSSDPEGPAESLFQKPYFELLYGALREGGVITTQGCTFHFVIHIIWCPPRRVLRASCNYIKRLSQVLLGMPKILLPLLVQTSILAF